MSRVEGIVPVHCHARCIDVTSFFLYVLPWELTADGTTTNDDDGFQNGGDRSGRLERGAAGGGRARRRPVAHHCGRRDGEDHGDRAPDRPPDQQQAGPAGAGAGARSATGTRKRSLLAGGPVDREVIRRPRSSCCNQVRSKRSRFITLTHASMKSLTSRSRPSALA